MSMDRVLEGVDASRRAAWAQKYAADKRIDELESQLEQARQEIVTLKRRDAFWQRSLELCTCECVDRAHTERDSQRAKRIEGRVISLMADMQPRTMNQICMELRGDRNTVSRVIKGLIDDGTLTETDSRDHRFRRFLTAAHTATPN